MAPNPNTPTDTPPADLASTPAPAALEKQWAEQERREKAVAAKAEPQKDAPIEAQIEVGRCAIIPFPHVPTRPFRSEIGIEQSSVFVANSFKDASFERVWELEHPTSKEPIRRTLRVGQIDDMDRPWGVLNQSHQDLFYVLLEIWGKAGYPIVKDAKGKVRGTLTLSGYELVMAMCGDNAGHHYRRVRALLRCLHKVPILVKNVYLWQGLHDEEEFTLIDGFSWHQRKYENDPETVEVSIMF